MTDFEKQVAEELSFALEGTTIEVLRGGVDPYRSVRVRITERLANRVAAAIEAVALSAPAIRDTEQRPRWRWDEIALRALRGES